MAQLNNNNAAQAFLIGPLLATACLSCCMIFALLGIKIWWFKHRLTFDQHSTRNGAAGGSSQNAFGAGSYRSGSGGGSLRDKQRLQQVEGTTAVHGVFRKRQEDDWDIERTPVLPAVRLSASSPNLKFMPPSSRQNQNNNEELETIVETTTKNKRKAVRSVLFNEIETTATAAPAPPTREPPKPPAIETVPENIQQQKVITATEAEHETECFDDNIPTTSQTRFRKVKPPAYDLEASKNLAQRRVTGYLPPNLEALQAINATELPVGERSSYVEYEKVDECDSLNLLQQNSRKSDTMGSIIEAEHNDVSIKLFDDLEDTNVENTVQNLWHKIEEHSNNNNYVEDAHMEYLRLQTTNNHDDAAFRMIRHSYEMNEADILDVRQELNELQISVVETDALVTTPTGFGKTIEDDWENFENLSMMQIFEPRVELPETTSIEQQEQEENNETLFHALEMPTTTAAADEETQAEVAANMEEEGATALDLTDEMQFKLPDYDAVMEENNLILPDYEAAMENVSKRNLNYVSSIEDLYEELNTTTQKTATIEAAPPAYTADTAYITNIDELYRDLGLEHQPSVRYPTESYLDTKTAEPMRIKVQKTLPLDYYKAAELQTTTTTSSEAPPQAAQRKPRPRLKVRFDIERSEYYQPEELQTESDSSSDMDVIAPTPKERFNKLREMYATESSSRSTMPPMLFGAQVTNLDTDDEDADAESNSNWKAITQHRTMTTQFQQQQYSSVQIEEIIESPATTPPALPTSAPPSFMPQPAARHMPVVMELRPPIAAARKTSTENAVALNRDYEELLDYRDNNNTTDA